MTFKSLAIGALATSAAGLATELHPASLEAVKYASAICGLVYIGGKIIHAVISEATAWANLRVKMAVREEIKIQFAKLPCGHGLCSEEREVA